MQGFVDSTTVGETVAVGVGKPYDNCQLDVGCGANKQPGFLGIDIRPLPGVDIVHDLEEFPWPLEDEVAIRAMASHVLEHINPHKGVFMRFMDEVWRVLKPGGRFAIVVPHGRSDGYLQDPTHCNACNENTWMYFTPGHPLYEIYKPRPWRVVGMASDPSANIEVIMEKVQDDR